MKSAGSDNPVFLLDEIDKMAMDFRGDPAAALLEVGSGTKPTFSDHYIEVPFDFQSDVYTTANVMHNIPRPLLDRMEVLYIPGYTELEKQKIADTTCCPSSERTRFNWQTNCNPARGAAENHSRVHSGIRCANLGTADCGALPQSSENIGGRREETGGCHAEKSRNFFGPAKYRYGIAEAEDQVGAATGLAWTEAGGDTLSIEVTLLPGKGKLTLTGKLGDVMKESAQAAFSYIRSRADTA